MKKIIILLGSLFLLGCSAENTEIQSPTKTAKKPVAVKDHITAVENEELKFSGLLDNDTAIDNSRIYSIDSETSQGGTIKDNRDNTYTYFPPQDFIGEDSFFYTICVPGDLDRCSTAEVIISVEDAGSPEAKDDIVYALQGKSTTYKNLLDNDILVDGASISSVTKVKSTGSVFLNEDGSVTYTSSGDFSGEETFEYVLCDNDQPQSTCSTATVTVTVAETVDFNIPPDLENYYSDFKMSTSRELNFDIISSFTIDKHHTILSYGQRHSYIYDADEDQAEPDNVILMYTGESRYWREYESESNSYSPQTFNTEHVYPQSKLNAADAVTDLHHLRVADAEVNSTRLNYPFTEGSGDARLITEESWYPGDEWKGDVARMVMYLNIRYGETFIKVGNKEMFLRWNAEDPVSSFELQRQEVIEGAQGNRNPFVDNPFLATLIWGGEPAENKWE